jgi:hypothetical protein
MNIKQPILLPVAGTLLLASASAVAAADNLPPLEKYQYDCTNRITASVRFGLNITAKYKNPGGSLNPNGLAANGQRTPHGDPYNYDDGYVYNDVRGAGPRTWYWGYTGNPNQLNYSQPNSIDFHRTTADSVPGSNSNDDSPYTGVEVTYDYLLGVKDDWHHLRYGVEVAANFMPMDINNSGTYHTGLSTRTDTYAYTPSTTPPGAPYYGGFGGPGFNLNSHPVSSVTAAAGTGTLSVNQDLNVDLWGFRLGPYVECPLTEKIFLHASGGLAVGILYADSNWKETYTPDGGGVPTPASGNGSDADVLWGYYLGLDAVYEFKKNWALDAGAQYQDIGVYSHNFGGRTAVLDLSQSIFVQFGISYSF